MTLLNHSIELIAPKTATETVTFSLSTSEVPARLTASGLTRRPKAALTAGARTSPIPSRHLHRTRPPRLYARRPRQ